MSVGVCYNRWGREGCSREIHGVVTSLSFGAPVEHDHRQFIWVCAFREPWGTMGDGIAIGMPEVRT